MVKKAQTLLFLLLWSVPAFGGEVAKDKNSGDSRLFAKLNSPMTSIVDGRSFRDGVTRITDSIGVNVWIDRHIDPSRVIDSGQLGPTAFMALRSLASNHGCVVMPIRSVVLIGNDGWVDRTAKRLLACSTGKRIDVSWSQLTTPSEAIEMVAKLDANAIQAKPNPLPHDPLPHDLWPEIHWKQIESTVAVGLIVSQFNHGEPISDREKRRIAKLRSSHDRKLSIAAEKIKVTDPLASTFSLTTQTRAGDVLVQLCAAANLKCVIADESVERCQQVVSISESDVTLRQLIETVAKETGIVPDWDTGQVIFRLATPSD